MDRTLLLMVGIVFLVALVGVLTVVDVPRPSGDLAAGNVVTELPEDCTACSGSPVCGGRDGVARNYDSACAARCDYARILYDGVCERIPPARDKN